MSGNRIYLDHAATTPMRAEAAEAMRAVTINSDFNPNSVHAEGRRARALLDDARERISALLGVSGGELTFTSGGTEADNLAIVGVMKAAARPAHIVTTAIEHSAVLATVDALRRDGVERTLVAVTTDGEVRPAEFAAALRTDTVLASVMYANNEVGTIQPIAELAEIARNRGVFFHTDAVAAAGWLPIGLSGLKVDLLSLSAHKFGGPAGVGLLYVRKGIPIEPLLLGGGQEFGRRAGTQDVAGIVGMAVALELAVREQAREAERVGALRDRLESRIAGLPDVRINGAAGSRLANVLNVSFAGVDSAALLIALDLAGVAVSAGSACASGVPEPSHVLAAMGIGPSWERGAIRFSLGHATGESEIERVAGLLPGILANLRAVSGAAPAGGWVD